MSSPTPIPTPTPREIEAEALQLLATAWQELEERLRERYEVAAEAPLPGDPNIKLGFDWRGGQMALVITCPGQDFPITKTNPKTMQEAVGAVPALLAALHKKTQDTTRNYRGAERQLRVYIADLSKL